MEWLNTLVKKLPTWRGITEFFYVATHWSTISHDFEEHRRQIQSRDEWMKAQEQNLTRIHELEIKKISAEFEHQVKSWRDSALHLVELYSEAVLRLSVFYHFDPLLWALARDGVDPELRERIEGIMARLPPPPPPPALDVSALPLSERRLSDALSPLLKSERTPTKKP